MILSLDKRSRTVVFSVRNRYTVYNILPVRAIGTGREIQTAGNWILLWNPKRKSEYEYGFLHMVR